MGRDTEAVKQERMDMNLYRWMSNYLADWAAGDIIVMAGSIEEAREKARAYFKKEVREYKIWEDVEENPESDQAVEYMNYKSEFESDISKEPTIIEDGVVFIAGSA